MEHPQGAAGHQGQDRGRAAATGRRQQSLRRQQEVGDGRRHGGHPRRLQATARRGGQ